MHIRPPRTPMQQPRVLIQLLRSPNRIHLDAPVIQIPRVPPQPQIHRRFLREVAVPDPLHPPPHEPPPRRFLLHSLSCYSARSAPIGSIDAARRAGTSAAPNATTPSR